MMPMTMARLENIVPADTTPSSIAELLECDGYVIVERLSPALVSQAVIDLMPHIDATNRGNTYFEGKHVRNVEGLVTRSQAAEQLMVDPTVLAVTDQILLPYCVRYQLNWTSCRHLEPGCETQYLHRDGQIYPFKNPHPPTQLATMWAGTDFTADNGATMIVPGSHLWEEDRDAREDEAVTAEMPVGSVLMYTSGTLHGGGANRSSHARTGVAVQYSLGWLRQEENLHLEIPPSVAKNLSERLQGLVGYEFGAPYLGFVHGDDPARLLGHHSEALASYTRPEIDDAAARLKLLRLGDMTPVETPHSEAKTVATMKGPIQDELS